MSIANKAISTTFSNIIIRTYHGQTSSLITSFNMAIHDVTWLVFVKTFWTRITPVFFIGRHYHRISQQLPIYRMNSVNVFTTLKVHGKHYMHCVTHCVRLKPHHKMLYPMIAWLYASEMRSCQEGSKGLISPYNRHRNPGKPGKNDTRVWCSLFYTQRSKIDKNRIL
jgi:hypothetical protein